MNIIRQKIGLKNRRLWNRFNVPLTSRSLPMFSLTVVSFAFVVYAACVIIPSILDELVNSH